MRENKFKAWNKVEKKMGVVRILDFVCEMVQVKTENKFSTWGFEYIELMEYTGRKDINEQEIYEGDILNIGDGKVPTLIKWENENAKFIAVNLKRREEHDFDKYFYRFIGEIIGNIYENPELLEVK